MSKVFIDTFTYRWKRNASGYYFGADINNQAHLFQPKERIQFLNELISSLLIHEKVVIKLDSLEELELLIGIENVLKLFNDNALEIIDDKGTMVGFIKGNSNNYILMNFSDCEGLQLEATEKRLTQKYYGKINSKKVQPLLLNVEKNKIDIDGSWCGHLVEQELMYDLENKNLTSLLNIKSEDRVNIPENETLPFMRLCYLNRSLIYQHKIGADVLLTEGFANQLLESKISPIFRNQSNPKTILEDIFTDKALPDLGELVINGILKFEHIITLRNSIDGKKFRYWYKEKKWNKETVYEELMSLNKSINSKTWVQLVRWFYPKLMGLATNAFSGIGIAAIDTLIVGKLLNGWHPNFFLDNQLKNTIDKEIQKKEALHTQSQTYKRLGAKIKRNDPCPCGSEKKFKQCCGK